MDLSYTSRYGSADARYPMFIYFNAGRYAQGLRHITFASKGDCQALEEFRCDLYHRGIIDRNRSGKWRFLALATNQHSDRQKED